MINDQAIAENLAKLISKRDNKNDPYISFENKVFDGIRYITFIGTDSADFRESYYWTTFISDMLGMDGRKETWRNPHFNVDWETIKPFLIDAIDDDEKTPIVLSGYGVAGSIALMAGYYLTMRHKNLRRVVTFGAPPSLNYKKLRQGFKCPLQQITHQYALKNDPLPKMFRWTKYCSADRTQLDFITKGSEIGNYYDALIWMDL